MSKHSEHEWPGLAPRRLHRAKHGGSALAQLPMVRPPENAHRHHKMAFDSSA